MSLSVITLNSVVFSFLGLMDHKMQFGIQELPQVGTTFQSEDLPALLQSLQYPCARLVDCT